MKISIHSLVVSNIILYFNCNKAFWSFAFPLIFVWISGSNFYAQAPGCPNVYAGEDVELDCDTDCTELTATFLDTGETTGYAVSSIPYDPPFPFTGGTSVSVNTDDVWSQIIPLPFDFCFYGVNYSQFLVGSNGVITFDTNNNPPGGYCPWSFSASIPSPSLISASINGAYMDINPATSGSGVINYAFFGEAPCRTLVVSFPDIPYYGSACVGMTMTSQIVIYETTNVIEIYIENREDGCTWNNGYAIAGIQNEGGTQGITAPGRNTSDWEAFEEAWRFTPNGDSNVEFVWLDGDMNVIGTDTTITVCPEEDTEYTAQATYTMCDGETIVTSDTVLVTVCPMAEPDCDGESFVEDFGTGEGRFETPYTDLIFQPVGQIDGGMYAVSNTTAGMNSGWHVMNDHTGNTNGMMFAVNPEFFGQELYRRTVPVTPEMNYTFSYWMATVYNTNTFICSGTGDPSNLILRIEDAGGNTIAETETGDVDNGSSPVWNEYTLNFNSGTNTEIQFVFINNALGVTDCGNDLVIDDISLTSEGDLPHVVTPEDLQQCDVSGSTSIFDLTVQIPVILDGQDPSEFNISFHHNEVDAANNNEPIAAPDAYTNTTNPETIWVRVEKTENIDCFALVNFDLIVIEGEEITTNLPDLVEICDGDEFPPLDATPTNPDFDLELVIYEWYLDGELISEEAILVPVQGGIYTVIITHDNCDTGTFTVEVVVSQRPTLDLGEDELLCEGDSFEIIPVISGAVYEITYLWSTGETTETITVSQSGTYTLEISHGVCTVSDSITVTFGEYPDVELGDTLYSCPGEIHTLFAASSIEEVTYTWYRNGELLEGETGNNIQIEVPQEIVTTSIHYTVEVSNNGCVSTDEIEVRAYPVNPTCIISQGLSPDHTPGYNDYLDLTFLANRSGIANVQIINRHGRLVYEKNDYVNEWAGQTNEGDLLPTGTYYYVISLKNQDPVYGNQITGWIYVNRK